MIINNMLLLSIISATFMHATEMPPMPPMPPIFETAKTTSVASQQATTPSSCQLIPPMVIHLPPPMEKELINCKNELFLPNKALAEKNLSNLLKKQIAVEKIEIVPKFNQLYKVTYNGGVILTNKSVDAFIKQ
ncbi:MAG: hypothetical protein H8E76_09020 [Helicobacteraceae bacterium]|nr:hypothetical protein [Candidatus Sulfurimonas ponti]